MSVWSQHGARLLDVARTIPEERRELTVAWFDAKTDSAAPLTLRGLLFAQSLLRAASPHLAPISEAFERLLCEPVPPGHRRVLLVDHNDEHHVRTEAV